METASTKLVYMEDMQKLEHNARVVSVSNEDGRTVIVLDETIFYPQGGGQPFDQGTIIADSGVFRVEEVRFVDGIVKHIGNFESGTLESGQTVHCSVDADRRHHHMRLHSGGHVVDMAVNQLGLNWIPGKGYHFPEGPYVEYTRTTTDELDKDALREQIEKICNDIVNQGQTTTIQFMPKDQMHTVCHHVPDYLPEGKPARVVMYGDFGVPCGGTHVANLKDIGPMTIRKLSDKKGIIRVSYSTN